VLGPRDRKLPLVRERRFVDKVVPLDRAAKTIAAILLLAGAGLFVWGSDKGFDFTDEGLYLLVYQHPGEFPDSYTSYHRVGAVVSQAFGHNIVTLRLAGFAAMALATFYFGFRLSVFLKGCGIPLFEQRGGPVFLHLALQGSVLAAYCWLPPTPNYNTMAGVGMLAFTGATLSFFSPRAGFRGLIGAVAALALAAAGFLLVFLAKGSSAVGIAIVSAVLLGFCGLIGIRQKAAFAACATGMVLAVAGFIFLLSPELFRSWEFFLASVAALLQGGGAAGMISRHWGEAVNFAVRHLDVYTVPLLIALAVGLFARLPLFSRDPARKGHLVFWGVAAALVAEVVLIAVRDAFLGGIPGRSKAMQGYTSLFVVLLLLAAGIPGLRRSIAPAHPAGFWLFIVWLAALPFATAAGTTHKININALLHAAPMSAASAILAASLDRRLGKNFALPAVCLLLAALGFAQFFSGSIAAPYRTAAKWEQVVPVEVGVPGTVLKLDAATAACIEGTKSALQGAGFQPGDDILALYGLPGLVYAVGGVSPRKPWFFDDHGPEGDEANLRSLKWIPAEGIKSAFVFQTNADPRVPKQLAECGVDFPSGYEKIGQATVPFKNRHLEIWKPKTR